MVKLINEVPEEYDALKENDIQSLADLTVLIFKGAFVLSKGLNGRDLTGDHLKHQKNYFLVLFEKKDKIGTGMSR